MYFYTRYPEIGNFCAYFEAWGTIFFIASPKMLLKQLWPRAVALAVGARVSQHWGWALAKGALWSAVPPSSRTLGGCSKCWSGAGLNCRESKGKEWKSCVLFWCRSRLWDLGLLTKPTCGFPARCVSKCSVLCFVHHRSPGGPRAHGGEGSSEKVQANRGCCQLLSLP